MAIKRISELHDWELIHPEQDIRGWKMKDEAGAVVGTVTDLVADTDQEMVTTVVLDNGEEYPAREIEIADGVVYVRGTHAKTQAGPVVKVYDETRVRRASAPATGAATAAGAGSMLLFSDYADEFRTHHRSNYADTGRDYNVYDPAYRVGFDYGMDKEHRGRSFSDLEPEMRRSYESKHGEGTWDRVESAVRHAFERARNLGTKSTTTGTNGDGYTRYADTFRTHYRSNLAGDEGTYDTYEPAYQHGYTYATNERYADRDYSALEPEMRRSYEERHGVGKWDRVKLAARHAFEQGRAHRTRHTAT